MCLVREYAACQSESAFATLVSRHTNLVYSAALRQTRDPQLAEEVAQVVFIILARKAGSLGAKTILTSWLYRTACFVSGSALKRERRRQYREQEAYMQSELDAQAGAAWNQLSPLLDDAMLRLGQTDRDALVLRYFEGRSLHEVGSILGAGEEAAKKRVTRALEKLRKIFTKRGVTLSVAAIAGAVAANSVQAAPVGLAKTISVVAMTKGVAAATSTLTLVKGALKIMAWTKAKTAIVIGLAAILAVGTTTGLVKKVVYPKSWLDDPSYWRLDNPPLASYPPVLLLRPTRFSGHGGGIGNWGRWLERDAAIQDLVAIAYGFRDTRIIFPPDLQQGRPRPGYDLMLTLPDQPTLALRKEIQRRFGLVGHSETITTNVWLLRVANPRAPGLKPASETSRQQPAFEVQHPRFTVLNVRAQLFDSFVYFTESEVGQPVVDDTGLKGEYDLHLQWRPQAGETDKDAFLRALSDQLGLELVPTNLPVEMLVVEKAK